MNDLKQARDACNAARELLAPVQIKRGKARSDLDKARKAYDDACDEYDKVYDAYSKTCDEYEKAFKDAQKENNEH
jgi:uncharacterized protein (DUF3084 family)